MTLLSFRSLLLSGILLGGTVAFEREGSANELNGIWFGEEKFPFFLDGGEEGLERFCSRVSVEYPFLRTYFTSEGTCENLDVDPLNGDIGERWFDNTLPEYNFIEKIVGWECSDECRDVISDPDKDDAIKFHRDYKVVAQACGRQLKKEQIQEFGWSCDAWQVTLLKKRDYSKDKSSSGYSSDDKDYSGDYSSDGKGKGRDYSGDSGKGRDYSGDSGKGSNDYSYDDDDGYWSDSSDGKGKGGDYSGDRGKGKWTSKGGKDSKGRRELDSRSKLNKRRKLMDKKDKKKNKDKKKDKKKNKDKKKDEKKSGGKHHDKDEYLVVLTVTYSDQFLTRDELIDSCPEYAIYGVDEIKDLDYAIGSIQFVLKASFEDNDLTNPCNWDCFDDHDGLCEDHYYLN